jgi:hypothetical protein
MLKLREFIDHRFEQGNIIECREANCKHGWMLQRSGSLHHNTKTSHGLWPKQNFRPGISVLPTIHPELRLSFSNAVSGKREMCVPKAHEWRLDSRGARRLPLRPA